MYSELRTQNISLCECGCGLPVNTRNPRRTAKFVHGHNRRGARNSPQSTLKFKETWAARGLAKAVWKQRPPHQPHRISEKGIENIRNARSGNLSNFWKGGVSRDRKHRNAIANIGFHKRRARKKQAGGVFSQSEWYSLKALYHYTCPCCLKTEPEIKLSIDHVVPLARGGRHDAANIQPLCMKCNRLKSTASTRYPQPTVS